MRMQRVCSSIVEHLKMQIIGGNNGQVWKPKANQPPQKNNNLNLQKALTHQKGQDPQKQKYFVSSIFTCNGTYLSWIIGTTSTTAHMYI